MVIILNMVVVVLMILFLLSVCGFGGLILGIFKAEPGQAGEYIVFSFASGVIVFSMFLLVLGKLGLFNRTAMLVFSAAFFLAAVFFMKKVLVSFRTFLAETAGISGWFLIILLILFLPRLLVSFFNVFIPPLSWDTMAYHYAIPALYKAAGKIFYIPYITHANWPQGIDIIFAWAMIVWGDILANGVCFVYACMMLVSAIVLGGKIFNSKAGFLAAAILGSFLYFKIDSSNGYVDLGLTFFEVAAFYAVFMYTKTKSVKYLISGVFCAAGAASVKILGLFSGAFLPAFILFVDYLPGGERKKLYFKEAVFFGLAVLAIASPWYIKSWIDTGNPVWPFAYSIFHGKNWSMELANYTNIYYSKIGGGKTLFQFLILPFKLMTSEHMDGFMGANIIYIYLMLPFTAYSIIKRKDTARIMIVLYSAVYVVFWFCGTQMTRFFFPGMAIMTVLAAGETERIMSEGKNVLIKFITAAAVIYLMLYSYPIRNFDKIEGLNCFLGIYEREGYLKKRLDYYSLYTRINADESINGRIVLFRELRGYYLKKDYIWGGPVNQGLISYKSTEQTLKDLQLNKVSFIIYNNNQAKEGARDYTDLTRKIMLDIITLHADLLYDEGGVCIYRLRVKQG